jgi:hypothetical protein
VAQVTVIIAITMSPKRAMPARRGARPSASAMALPNSRRLRGLRRNPRDLVGLVRIIHFRSLFLACHWAQCGPAPSSRGGAGNNWRQNHSRFPCSLRRMEHPSSPVGRVVVAAEWGAERLVLSRISGPTASAFDEATPQYGLEDQSTPGRRTNLDRRLRGSGDSTQLNSLHPRMSW